MLAVRKFSLHLGLMEITNEYVRARQVNFGTEIYEKHTCKLCMKYGM